MRTIRQPWSPNEDRRDQERLDCPSPRSGRLGSCRSGEDQRFHSSAFDECEIFLAKRGTDLERSAIVGIFLRLLDYYRGLLFLTTNRADMLDHAVLSRVMLKRAYPRLETTTRTKIWQTMFSVAGLRLDGCTFERLG